MFQILFKSFFFIFIHFFIFAAWSVQSHSQNFDGKVQLPSNVLDTIQPIPNTNTTAPPTSDGKAQSSASEMNVKKTMPATTLPATTLQVPNHGMCGGVELKKKRGWPKGKPRFPKKQKVESSQTVHPDQDQLSTPPKSAPPKPTAPKKADKQKPNCKTEPKEDGRVSSISPVETVRTLRDFIVKRMHFMYKFKSKLDEVKSESPSQTDHVLARAYLETMEAYLLKHLNRIREYKAQYDKTLGKTLEQTSGKTREKKSEKTAVRTSETNSTAAAAAQETIQID